MAKHARAIHGETIEEVRFKNIQNEILRMVEEKFAKMPPKAKHYAPDEFSVIELDEGTVFFYEGAFYRRSFEYAIQVGK